MALAELRRRVTIEFEGFGERCAAVRQKRVITGRSAGDFCDSAHADRVMIASGKHCLSRGRAQSCSVKAVEFEAARGQKLSVWCVTRAAEGAGGTKAGVVNQDEENIGRALRRAQLGDCGVLVFWILGIVQHQTGARWIGYGKNCSGNIVLAAH